MAQLLTVDLVPAFVDSLRNVMAEEFDPALRLKRMREMRAQMNAVLQLAPNGKDPEGEARFRAELTSSMEAAYLSILGDEAASCLLPPGALAMETAARH
ncbi:hypothetical protein [Roseomonas sp. WA12]